MVLVHLFVGLMAGFGFAIWGWSLDYPVWAVFAVYAVAGAVGTVSSALAQLAYQDRREERQEPRAVAGSLLREKADPLTIAAE